MLPEETENSTENRYSALREIAVTCLKLGTIGFGGIAGMVATLENELVFRRRWIDHRHFRDVLSASYLIPGPNAVEVVMHCGKERGGRAGLVIAGICYILPAMALCLLLGYFYKRYSMLPDIQLFIYGLRPATTALVIGTVFRLAVTTFRNRSLVVLCLLVFAGALAGINEVLLILGAGAANLFTAPARGKLHAHTAWLLLPTVLKAGTTFSESKLFLVFLKIGAVLYGSGYVLFAYMDESLVRNHHWLTRQQLMDAIVAGQITPGPVLSSATFAGYLIEGTAGGVIATLGIFLPSFFISFFLHQLLTSARKNQSLRVFLDGLGAASVSLIAVVAVRLFTASVVQWQGAIILVVCLALMLFVKRINGMTVMVTGSLAGYLLLQSVL